MLCRSCGRDSRTITSCEWCHQPLSVVPPPQPTTQMPAGNPPTQAMPMGQQPTLQIPQGAPPYPVMPGSQPTTQLPPGVQPTMQGNAPTRRRVSLTGEVIEDAAPPPPPMAPTGVIPAGMGHIPATAYTAQAVQAQLQGSGTTPMGERWEKFLAIALPLIALSMLIVHIFPGSFLYVGFADMFFIPMALGAVGAVPSYDDAIADCSVVLIVSLLFGPALALVVYLIVCAFKQECNGALVALLLISLILPFLLLIPFLSTGLSWDKLGAWGLFNIFSFVRVFLGFAGWFLSSFFRQENE
ncbi:MAG TPA: hypothetical protein VKU00_15545 [Chthonomonadaceae bacterium]|nr:hypothetical protein [Chthonomonadaceae bacterium]